MSVLQLKKLTDIQNIAEKGLFHLLAVNGLIYVIGFASQLFVAGILDPADIGRIKIMQTYISLAALIGGFGFNTSLLRLASEQRSEEEKISLLHLSMLVATVSFLLLYVIFYFCSKLEVISNDPIINRIFPYYAFFLLPLNLQSMQLSYYQAIKKIKKMAIIQFYVKLMSVVLIILATYIFKLKGYVAIISITGLISVLSLRIGLLGYAKRLFSLNFRFRYLGILWQLAKFALLANLVGTLFSTMDVYIINYMVKDQTAIGYYMFALTIVSLYKIIPASIQQVAMPFFSSKSDNNISWFNAYKKYNKLNHIITVILCLAGIFVIPPCVKYAFSGKYDASIVPFEVLSFAWMLASLNMMKGTALMGFGKFNINFNTSLIILVVSFPIMFYLIKQLGLNGALIGKIFTGAVIYVSNFIVFRSFVKKQNLIYGL